MMPDSTDRQDMDDARLARINPEAYKAKQEAKEECNPLRILFSFLRKIFSRNGK